MSDQAEAAPELEKIQFEAVDRSSFLMKGVLAAGAAYGALAAGPVLRKAFAQSDVSEGDLEILNFALLLELLESEFYALALKQANELSSEVRGLAELLGKHEDEHVVALTGTIEDLGGKPVAKPEFDFGDAFASEDSFLALSMVLEDTGVSAYNGAAPLIESKDLLSTAGQIVQIEGRHAAAIRFAYGKQPAPNSFDPVLTMDEVLTAAGPFIKGGRKSE